MTGVRANADLHTHSTASDGSLSPVALIDRAADRQLRIMALTDHDTVAGLNEAAARARAREINLIPGIELSLIWETTPVHVLGLGIEPGNVELVDGIAALESLRVERAETIGLRLAKLGFKATYAGACALSGNARPGRAHFARHLVASGMLPSMQEAFTRLLKRGRPAYAATKWPALATGIGWIRAAGGVAVLAHPLHYELTASKLRRLAAAFADVGGEAMEVINGHADAEAIETAAALARRLRLAGSAGSDFHAPDTPWSELGRLPEFPRDLIHVLDLRASWRLNQP